MLTISKPLSGGQARTYHAREFAAKEANYWSREQQGHSEWQGKLAQEWGLQGAVGAEQFARLTEGQHPNTQEQMVRHQPAKTYENQFGREVTSVEHRAGWDATFSAPKSVSLTALVGGDERVREVHRESVRIGLGELERYTQARLGEAVQGLERQGRVHEVKDPAARIEAIAKEYARSPDNTLVVSPDNRSRAEINARIHTELQSKGVVGKEEYKVASLVPRQDLTGADRTWAARYQFNDVLLYSRTSKETGIEKGEYARVKSVDAPNNLLTVVRADGSEQTYDPRRQQGVSIYKEEEKAFSVGDRIQFTAPAKDLKVANRELGTVQSITDDGRMSLKMDGGRNVSINPREHPHLDHGYAVTSHSSQGQTADRVLIHIDTELGAKDLINNRMAYVSVSRGAHDAQIFTSDREKLPEALSRDVSHQSAHVPEIAQSAEREIEPKQAVAPAEKVYTIAEHERHWGPLKEAVTPLEAQQFAWKQETGTIHSYQHIETGRYLHIDGADGEFCDRNRDPISAKEGLDHAMPEGQMHSHSKDLPELSIEQQGFGLGL